MLISLKHRIALLAMPKTASTSLESVLAGSCDIVLQHTPRLKHMTLQKFERHMRPILTSVDATGVETACLFRDPVDWLVSWHAYRSRDALAGMPKSTGGLGFDAFVRAYLSPDPPEYARVGRQSRFIGRHRKNLVINHLFAYEKISGYVSFLEDRFGKPLALPRLNASHPVDRDLTDQTRHLLETELAEDFRIHRSLMS